ncbi:MAG: DUF4911 domain-containing protein [Desulfobacterales bacterium]
MQINEMWLLFLTVLLCAHEYEIKKILTTIKQHYRVDRRKIAFIKFILEGYDGMAMMKTMDPVKGIITLHISPGCEKHVKAILQDLKENILMQDVGAIPSKRD